MDIDKFYDDLTKLVKEYIHLDDMLAELERQSASCPSRPSCIASKDELHEYIAKKEYYEQHHDDYANTRKELDTRVTAIKSEFLALVPSFLRGVIFTVEIKGEPFYVSVHSEYIGGNEYPKLVVRNSDWDT